MVRRTTLRAALVTAAASAALALAPAASADPLAPPAAPGGLPGAVATPLAPGGPSGGTATVASATARAAFVVGRSRVAALQVALPSRGLYWGAVDGRAGPLTRAAVRRFQARRGLAVDGIAGPRTRAALGWRGRPPLGRRPVRAPAKGWDVAALQFLLATTRAATATSWSSPTVRA